MRRLLTALAAAVLLTGLASAPAHAVDTRWYKFNWCDRYEVGPNDTIHICSGIQVRRQNDGSGLLIDWLSHYLDITALVGGDPDDCDPDAVEQDPAAKNNHTEIDAESLGGQFQGVKFEAEAPNGNLNGANHCSIRWSWGGSNIVVNTQQIDSFYNYFLRINIINDVTDGNHIEIWVAGDGSLKAACYVNDRCNRTIL